MMWAVALLALISGSTGIVEPIQRGEYWTATTITALALTVITMAARTALGKSNDRMV